jgi:Terpene synthase family 2, C-terminal metal binding
MTARGQDLPDEDLPLFDSIPPLLNVHVEAARVHLTEWVQQCGLVQRAQARARFERADFAWFAAQTYPVADEAGLCLIADWFAWLFLLDDQFDDGLVGRDLSQVQAVMNDLLNVLASEPGGPRPLPERAPAIVVALADLWKRTAPLSSRRWRQRFIEHIAAGGAAAFWEASNRVGHVVPDRRAYVEKRRHTGAIYVCMDLIEVVDGIDLPADVLQGPLFEQTLGAACDVVCWTNDLYSARKEASLREYHNLVLITEHIGRLPRAQAFAVVAQDTAAELGRFLELESRVLTAWPEHGDQLQKYLSGMRSWMRGNYDWSRRTKRYDLDAAGPADYLEPVTASPVGVTRSAGSADE